MKKLKIIIIILLISLIAMSNYYELDPSVETRINNYINQMSLSEKIDQLSHIRGEYFGCEDNTRLGIPGFAHADGPHGINWLPSTCFPVNIANTATWDPEYMEILGEALAKEFRGHNRNQMLGPSVDIQRDPRNGRSGESCGEDPYLGGKLNVGIVNGAQNYGMVATAKHCVGINHQTDRDNYNHLINERSLMEFYIKPFHILMEDSNVRSIMNSYNKVNGYRSSENWDLLTGVLRNKLGYKYYVVSDWFEVENTKAAIEAGTDVCMGSDHFLDDLENLVNSGQVSMDTIDEAVRRVLRTKIESGIIDGLPPRDTSVLNSAAHRNIALEVARKSIILLKNKDNILPLNSNGGSIAMIGPSVKVAQVDGRGSSYIEPTNPVTPYQGILNKSSGVTINYAHGCDINSTDMSGFSAALDAARNSDYVIFVGGLDNTQEGEQGHGDEPIYDRKEDAVTGEKSFQLPGRQQELINQLASVNPNIIVVIKSGGICGVNRSIDNIKGLLYAFYPGVMGGDAIADIIFGNVNPSGKLPVTMPKNDNQLPDWNDLDFSGDEIDGFGYRRFDKMGWTPEFAFGFGLSYTTFSYSNINVTPSAPGNGSITVTADVANTGSRSGEEVIQLYLSKNISSVPMPVKQLKGFDKIHLEPGQTKTVTFTLDWHEFNYWSDTHDSFFVESGTYTVRVGGSSDNLPLTSVFEITSDYKVELFPPDPQDPFLGYPAAIPGKIEIENYDLGGNNVAYYDTTSGNDGNVYRNDDVDLEAANDIGGGFNNGWTNAGEWLEYTVDIASSGTYDIDIRYASEADGGVIRIGFDGVDATGPISLGSTDGWQSWSTKTIEGINLSAGTKIMRVSYDAENGNLNWINFTYNPDLSVRLISPEDGDKIKKGNILLEAETTGDVARVNFIVDNTQIGEDNTAPYEYLWQNVDPDNYTITAQVVGLNGTVIDSDPVNIEVIENFKPTVTLLSPTDGAKYGLSDDVLINADAEDSDGQVSYVVFKIDGNTVNIDSSSPYSYNAGTLSEGPHSITVLAVDNENTESLPADANITVSEKKPPIINLTSPADGRIYKKGQTILLDADAQDSDGNVTKVEFYANSIKIGESTAAPFQYEWTDADIDNYVLTAKATDNDGLSTISDSVNITVEKPDGIPIPGKIEVEDYNAYYDTTPGNTGGVYKNDDVDIEECDLGGYNVGWIADGEWLEYNVAVTESGIYSITIQTARETSESGSLHVELDSVNISGSISVPSTGGWQNFITTTKTGVSLQEGSHVLRIVMESGPFNINWIEFKNTGNDIFVEAENYSDMYGINTEDCNEGGRNVGWIEPGDWMEYNVNAAKSGNYKIEYRVAGWEDSAGFKLFIDGQQANNISVPNTGAYQNWTSVYDTVTLNSGEHTFRIEATGPGWNINWFKLFNPTDPMYTLSLSPTGLTNGSGSYKEGSIVTISYTGDDFKNWSGDTQTVTDINNSTTTVTMNKNISLTAVTQGEDTEITVQAEDYETMSGIEVGPDGTTVGWIDIGDWLEYKVNITSSSENFSIDFHVANMMDTGKIDVIVDGALLTTFNVPNTGGWSNWQTVEGGQIKLTQGTHTIRLYASGAPWNIDWFKIKSAAQD